MPINRRAKKKQGKERDDMEKDDKIRNQQAKVKKMVFAAGVVLLGLYGVVTYSVAKPSGIGGALRQSVATVSSADLVNELASKVKLLDGQVRAIKKTGVIMEADPESLKKTKELQEWTRKLCKAKYGDHGRYRVKLNLLFQPSIPDYATKGKDGQIVIEMAPIDLIPVSVYNFLEIARTWKSGAFHRNAGHVLQVNAFSDIKDSMPFQEYSKDFPHKKGTTGYAGRPSGPGWYVSIQDNTVNHGPGSQQQKNPYEADSNFGTVVEGMDDVVPRIHSTPQTSWLDDKNKIRIIKMTILVPDGQGGWKEWIDPTKTGVSQQEIQ